MAELDVGAANEHDACSICLLDEIGVQEDDLSQAGRRTLGILAQVAAVLNVDQVHMSEYLTALDALNSRQDVAADAIAALQDDMKKITMRSDRARHELTNVVHVHETLRAMAEEREITENSTMFKHWARDYGEKERQYAQDIEQCNAELRARRFPMDESLEHHTLVAMAEDCAAIEASNYELASRLALYKTLPSTVEESRQILEAMEAELMQLGGA